MTTRGEPQPPLAAEAARLVADALTSALANLVETLGTSGGDPSTAGRSAADAPTGPLRQLPRAGLEAGVGAAQQAVRLPTRAATNLLNAVASDLVPAVLQRLDLNALLDRVDVQRVVDRVDTQGVVRRVDLNELAGQVDLNELAGRVDLNELAGRVDLNELAGRVDVDALLARVDVDELVGRLDVGALTREAMEAVDIGEVIRESTATLGSDAVEAARVQAMRADDLVSRIADRVLRRSAPRDTALERPGGPL
jgi:hypothetical protein